MTYQQVESPATPPVGGLTVTYPQIDAALQPAAAALTASSGAINAVATNATISAQKAITKVYADLHKAISGQLGKASDILDKLFNAIEAATIAYLRSAQEIGNTLPEPANAPQLNFANAALRPPPPPMPGMPSLSAAKSLALPQTTAVVTSSSPPLPPPNKQGSFVAVQSPPASGDWCLHRGYQCCDGTTGTSIAYPGQPWFFLPNQCQFYTGELPCDLQLPPPLSPPDPAFCGAPPPVVIPPPNPTPSPPPPSPTPPPPVTGLYTCPPTGPVDTLQNIRCGAKIVPFPDNIPSDVTNSTGNGWYVYMWDWGGWGKALVIDQAGLGPSLSTNDRDGAGLTMYPLGRFPGPREAIWLCGLSSPFSGRTGPIEGRYTPPSPCYPPGSGGSSPPGSPPGGSPPGGGGSPPGSPPGGPPSPAPSPPPPPPSPSPSPSPPGGGGGSCPPPVVNCPPPTIIVQVPPGYSPPPGGSPPGSPPPVVVPPPGSPPGSPPPIIIPGPGGGGSPPGYPPGDQLVRVDVTDVVTVKLSLDGAVDDSGKVRVLDWRDNKPAVAFPDWCDVNIWEPLAAGRFTPSVPKEWDLLQILDLIKSDGTFNDDSPWGKWIVQLGPIFGRVAQCLIEATNSVVGGAFTVGGSPAVAYSGPALIVYLAEFIEKFTGVDLKSLRVKAQYMLDYLHPDLMPGASGFNEMLMNGVINFGQWEAGVRANNECPDWQVLLNRAGRVRPGLAQAWMLTRLGLLGRPLTAADRLKYGIYDEDEWELMRETTKSWPGWSETIDLANKGVFDEAYAAKYRTDEEADEILTQAGMNYAHGSGTVDELFKHRWRGHWTLPTEAEILRMYFRFRKGRVPDDLVVTEDELDQLLAQKHVAPGWRARMQQIARPIIGLRHIVKVYDAGTLSFEQSREELLDIGFTEDKADAIMGAYKSLKLKRLISVAESSEYIGGGVSDDELKQAMRREGGAPDEILEAFDWVKKKSRAKLRSKRVAVLRNKFMLGETNQPTAVGELQDIGLSTDQAADLAAEWDYDIKTEQKEVNAAQLVKWFETGIIDESELRRRLGRMKFKDSDIGNIVTMANYEIAVKVAQAQAKIAAAEAKAVKAAADAAKKEQQAIAKARKDLESFRTNLAKAADKLSVGLGVSIEEATNRINSLVDAYRSQFHGTNTGVMAIVKEAVAAAIKKKAPPWEQVVSDLFYALSSEQARH